MSRGGGYTKRNKHRVEWNGDEKEETINEPAMMNGDGDGNENANRGQ